MTDAFASSFVNHFGRANRDYFCTHPNGSAWTLPKDTKIVIIDMDSSRNRFDIWWESRHLYALLTVQAGRSLIITLPERRWTTNDTQDRLLRVDTNVETMDKYNKSITYSAVHWGYVSRMSTDGMFFIVNILHGLGIGRQGVRIHVRYGRVMDYRTCEMTHWMHRRLEFLKDYTCFNPEGEEIITFKKGDCSCVVRGIGAGTTVLRVNTPKVGAHRYPLRVDISAHAVMPGAICYEQDSIDRHFYTKSLLFRDGMWIRADRLEPEDSGKGSSIVGLDYGWGNPVGGWCQ
jgi:hypothetical protein